MRFGQVIWGLFRLMKLVNLIVVDSLELGLRSMR